MTGEKDKEPEVIWSDQVKMVAEADPELAEFLREFGAISRQAMAGVQSGQYASFEDAIFALTGNRPKKVELDDIEGE